MFAYDASSRNTLQVTNYLEKNMESLASDYFIKKTL